MGTGQGVADQLLPTNWVQASSPGHVQVLNSPDNKMTQKERHTKEKTIKEKLKSFICTLPSQGRCVRRPVQQSPSSRVARHQRGLRQGSQLPTSQT